MAVFMLRSAPPDRQNDKEKRLIGLIITNIKILCDPWYDFLPKYLTAIRPLLRV